jgi:hypothetical protein
VYRRGDERSSLGAVYRRPEQATQQNNLRLKQDQQLLDQSKAFAGGLPTNPDGTPNYSAIMNTLAEKGDVNAISQFAPILQQQQNTQGANAPDPILGGGSSGGGGSGANVSPPAPGPWSGNAFLSTTVAAESEGNNSAVGDGGLAKGDWQFHDGTWQKYAKNVPGASQYASADEAPAEVQTAVAEKAPISEWGPRTKAILHARFGAFDESQTIGQLAGEFGGGKGGGMQVASAGASDAPAYASPDKPSIPPVSAAAGSTIPRENSSTAVGAVGGSPQQSRGGPLAANNPAWAGINASLPVGPTGAPAQAQSAPAPRAPAPPPQVSVASISSQAGIPPQVAANIAAALKVAPGAPLTPEQAQRAKTIIQNTAQRLGQQQQQQTAGGQGQPQGQPQSAQPMTAQIRLPTDPQTGKPFTDPMAAIQAINQDINRYSRFTAGQGGEVAIQKIRQLEWQRDQILKQSEPMHLSTYERLVDPRTGQNLISPSTTGTLTPDAVDRAAHDYDQSGKLPTNLGRGQQGAANISAILDRASELHPDEDPNARAERWQAFNSNVAGERTLSNRSANFTLAENSAASVMPRVIEASKAVDRTQYPSLNRIIEMAKVGTGDPAMVRFGTAAETLAQAYATAMTPIGKSTVSMQDHARDLLDKAWSQGQVEAAIDQMQKEMSSEKSSLNRTRKEFNLPPLNEDDDSGAGSSQGGGSGQSAAPSGVTSSGIKWSVH